MDNSKISTGNKCKYSFAKKTDRYIEDTNDIIEIVDEENIKKIEAYLEWEQEYYLINQSYLLEEV